MILAEYLVRASSALAEETRKNHSFGAFIISLLNFSFDACLRERTKGLSPLDPFSEFAWKRTRTSTGLPPLVPETSVSTNSTIQAFGKILEPDSKLFPRALSSKEKLPVNLLFSLLFRPGINRRKYPGFAKFSPAPTSSIVSNQCLSGSPKSKSGSGRR